MMEDLDLLEELKARLAERYVSVEIVEALDISVEEIIDTYIDRILDHPFLLKSVGMLDD